MIRVRIMTVVGGRAHGTCKQSGRVRNYLMWKSGRRESNPQRQAWKACTLPLSYARGLKLCSNIRSRLTILKIGVPQDSGGYQLRREALCLGVSPHRASVGWVTADARDVDGRALDGFDRTLCQLGFQEADRLVVRGGGRGRLARGRGGGLQ